MTKIISFLLLLCFFTACQKKDINALKSEISDLKNRVTRLEDAAKKINTDISSLTAIATALQAQISVVSYTTTANGYELTMSDGSKINLTHGKDGANGTNGKDGVNAPVIGLKQDADGNYYWTIEGDWLLQNEQKVKANGTNGNNGTTPLLMVNATSNQWMVSYDNGNTWSVIKDGNGNPITATGAQGPQGQPGAQGPAGVGGFSITETDAAVIITYGGNTYTLPKGGNNGGSNTGASFIVFSTTKSIGEIIKLNIDADLAERADVWIDLNNDKLRGPGENIAAFGAFNEFRLVSNTITIYGNTTAFSCPYEKVNKLDVSNNPALKNLLCYDNELEELNLSKNTNLELLWCNENQLNKLDVSKNTELWDLLCQNNKLYSLDVTQNRKLRRLSCSNNQISMLDISNNRSLTGLYCFSNAITTDFMELILRSLPTRLDYDVKAYIFSEKPGELNGLPGSDIISAANAKGWKLFKQPVSGEYVELLP